MEGRTNMPDSIVKYNNRFNKISTKGIGFSRTDYDLLFFMCMKAVERGSDKINITFSELKEATGIDAYKLSKKQMIDLIDNFYNKLLQFQYSYTNVKGDVEKWVVFYGYKTNLDNGILSFSVSDEAIELFNNLKSEFTVFEYMQQKQLKTVAGKGLYKLLKQWRTVGIATYDIEEIKNALDIDDSQPPKEVTRKIKTAITDLKRRIPEQYSSLELSINKQGKEVVSYTFTFEKEEAMVQKKDPYVIDYYGYVKPEFTEKEMLKYVDKEYIDSLRSRKHVSDQNIQEEIKKIAYREYWNKIKVVTDNFNAAVFEAKTDDIFLTMADIYDKTSIKFLREDMLEAIALIKDKDLIYELNNLSREAWFDLINECEDFKENGKLQKSGYLKKKIEEKCEKKKLLKSVKEIL